MKLNHRRIDSNTTNKVVLSSADDTWEPKENVASTGHIDKYECN
jgi:hypothetical protein